MKTLTGHSGNGHVGPKGFRLGVDVGGTFTDFALLDLDGLAVHSLKVLTTPDAPSRAIFDGLERLCAETGAAIERIGTFVHATTLIGNAVIERRGARTALVTTEGFRDVLQFRRELRYDLLEPHLEFPEPLVPRALRFEVAERMDAGGSPLVVPREEDVAAIAERLAESGVEAVAVSFLHSYVNPEHERVVGERLAAAAPGLAITLSSDVLRQIREYERTSAAVINAYVQPLTRRYLDDLVAGLRARGCPADVLVVTSTGGTVPAETAARLPIQLVESGPAAGVVFAARLSTDDGARDRVAFDMGGTTAKVTIVRDGRAIGRTDHEVARTRRFKAGSGMPIGIPVLDLLEIGSGGGSIAEVDETGLIRVGP